MKEQDSMRILLCVVAATMVACDKPNSSTPSQPKTIINTTMEVWNAGWSSQEFVLDEGADVDVALTVLKGDTVNFCISTPEEWEQQKRGNAFRVQPEFSGKLVKEHRISSHLGKGTYVVGIQEAHDSKTPNQRATVSLTLTRR